jgi:hypothetical protein
MKIPRQRWNPDEFIRPLDDDASTTATNNTQELRIRNLKLFVVHLVSLGPITIETPTGNKNWIFTIGYILFYFFSVDICSITLFSTRDDGRENMSLLARNDKYPNTPHKVIWILNFTMSLSFLPPLLMSLGSPLRCT